MSEAPSTGPTSNKPPPSVGAVIALALLLGMFGAHRFYLGDKKTGLIQLLMFIPGFLLIVPPFITAIWAIVDAIRSRSLVAQFS